MSAPLTNGQKAYLAQLSRRAWNLAAALARGRGEVMEVDSATWRHAEVAKACAKSGLRCCSQDDYKLVEGHFLNLLNEPGRTVKEWVYGAANPQRVWKWKLERTCEEFGFRTAYADAICRRQNHGAGLDEVGANVLKNLFYTVRNRGLARRRHAQEEVAA